MKRRVKIVATVGPSSNTGTTIKAMILSGMNVARLNFSHGTHEDHLKLIHLIRNISKELNISIAILQDLQGPKMRIGKLPQENLKLSSGELITFVNHIDHKENKIGEILIPLDIPMLEHILHPGMRVLLDDGKIETEVIEIKEGCFTSKVIIGGNISSNKGVNLPGESLPIDSFTSKDKEDLLFGLENGIDWIACSFVRSMNDIVVVKNAISAFNPEINIPIIAKLERPEAIKNLDGIMKITDGVMVARGDLGVETSPSQVPILQKEIIKTANSMGKIVITATQMLESMMTNTRPTRAEASDIANAVFDGTDAVMLSGETASGQYPIESIKMMDQIVCEAENHSFEWGYSAKTVPIEQDDSFALSSAVKELSYNRKASAIVVFTLSGKTALLISKVRPEARIIAFTPYEETYRRLSLYWGITPFLVPFARSMEEMITTVDKAILDESILKTGEIIVMISGLPVQAMRKPNLILLHSIGEKYIE